MIGYETEEQQVQAIKQFWKDNGTAIILGAVIGLGSLWGWRYYNDTTLASKEQASSAYSDSVDSFIASQNTDSLSEFMQANKDTGYAPLAALIVAQQAVNDDDYGAAKDALNAAIGKDAVISDVARIRLADLHIQLNEYSQAITVLNAVSAPAFSDQVEELKGDVFAAQGDFEAAKTAYAKSLEATPNNSNVKMKLDNIAYAMTQVSSKPSDAVQPVIEEASDAPAKSADSE